MASSVTIRGNDSRVARGREATCCAASELYHAELALHDAHQTGVDAWIAAAADHLHKAVERYLRERGAVENRSVVSSPARSTL